MNEFSTFHPIVNFTYFVFVIGFSMFFMHPICLCVSLGCAFAYSAMLRGKKTFASLKLMFPLAVVAAFFNVAFNHEGVTVLAYLPSGNPLTLESAVYGISAASMLLSVLCWFSCCNEIMTSDKLIYLFGKIIPSLSLVISMTLRFVPRFKAQLREIANAQKCMGRDISSGSIVSRARHGLNILSIMTTRCLENSVETAESMKARGYGLPGRTAFSLFVFDKRDACVLVFVLISGIYTFVGKTSGKLDFAYFPTFSHIEFSLFGISFFCTYLLLCLCPVIIELMEARKWNVLKSKI